MNTALFLVLAAVGMIVGWVGILRFLVITKRQVRQEFQRAVWPLWEAYRQLRDDDILPGS